MVLADGSQFIIWVSDRSNPRMLLYTVAHELGHYVLHCIMSSEADTKKHFFAARHQVGEVEAEADKFAINFLAPKRKIKKMLSSGNSVRQVSDELCVDVHLVKQQIKKYGLQFS